MKNGKKSVKPYGAHNLEAEGLLLLHQAREGKKLSRPFTIEHGLAVQAFYKKLLDTGSLRGLCLEGNHP